MLRVVTDPERSVGPARTDPTGRIPAYGVIVYPVIAEPFDGGGDQKTFADPTGVCTVLYADVALTVNGAPGTSAGITVTVFDCTDSPTTLVAVTLHVYVEPYVRSLNVI